MEDTTGRMRAGTMAVLVAAGGGVLLSGCMVGPDYHRPPAPVAPQYHQAVPKGEVQRTTPDLAKWWTVFNDPVLDNLIQTAYRQNPTLQSAAVRILEAQAQRGIAVGLLFPQNQSAVGGYTRTQLSKNQPNLPPGTSRSFDTWDLGAAATWELDVWGRFRRGIEAADATVLATVANYDDVLVTLTASVANEYLTIRILQERLAVAQANVAVQKESLQIAETRFQGGTTTELDSLQARALLRDTEATIPEIETSIAQAEDRLCVLLGIPPQSLDEMLGTQQTIPAPPVSVAVGIPADLLRRRPDIRRAERELAAQSAQIGIAKADLYPAFSLAGDIRLVAEDADKLFQGDSLQAFGGPTFRWNVLNYGRIENSVRVQDARFQALVGVYENTVLQAQSEVENAAAGYFGSQKQTALVTDSVAAARRAVEVADTQYRGGTASYTAVIIAQQFLLNEQDRLVTLRGSTALNLVSLYRALGGGWELRGDRVPLDEKIQAQMRQRTNWDKMLPPAPTPAQSAPTSSAPPPRPATQPAT